MYGDPEGIRRLARQVHAGADGTRADAARGSAAADVAWESVRAGRFRNQLAEAVATARAAAGELDELAALLEEHARVVEHHLELIAAAERWARSLAATVWQEAKDAAATSAHLAGQALHGVQHLAGSVVHGVTDLVGDARDGGERAAQRAETEAADAARRAEQLGRRIGGMPVGDLRWVGFARSQGWFG